MRRKNSLSSGLLNEFPGIASTAMGFVVDLILCALCRPLQHIRLLDYEKIVDKNGKRIVAFGRYAGAAGMYLNWHLGCR